jgi:hypothetical protein
MKELIKNLVKRGKEGTWWDFKLKHHENLTKLLHDILCLANVIHDGDRYIIIGVSKDYKIVGVNKCNVRYTQADILDYLKAKKFAGDNIPNILIDTILIDENEIDVITIKNERLKPYYLISDENKKGEKLRGGVIYSRLGDTNTPVDKCANPNEVELMWRERFGLDQKSTEKFKSILLDYQNWKYDGISKAFYVLDPDYLIEIGDEECSSGKYWWQNAFSEQPYTYSYSLKYKNVELHKLPVVRFQSENLCIPFPSIEFITYPEKQDALGADCYCDLFYYRKNSIEYCLFYHIRSLEIAPVTRKAYTTPIETQIKPAIIHLPFLILENELELEGLHQKIERDFELFMQEKERKFKKKEFSTEEKRRLECERFFSEWVLQKFSA